MDSESQALPTLRQQGDVYLLDLGDGENRFNPDRNSVIEELLAEVEAAPAPQIGRASCRERVSSPV